VSYFLVSKLAAWNLKKRDLHRQTLKHDENTEHVGNGDMETSCVPLVSRLFVSHHRDVDTYNAMEDTLDDGVDELVFLPSWIRFLAHTNADCSVDNDAPLVVVEEEGGTHTLSPCEMWSSNLDMNCRHMNAQGGNVLRQPFLSWWDLFDPSCSRSEKRIWSGLEHTTSTSTI
jgi:hypothetical protein